MRFTLALAILGTLAVPAAAQEGGEKPSAGRPGFPIGETLVYQAKAEGPLAALGGDLGKATITCSRATQGADGGKKGRPAIRVATTADGKLLGFTLDQILESFIDPETGAPWEHVSRQGGSNIHWKRTLFGEKQAEYWKMKHCKNEDGKCEKPHGVGDDPGAEHCLDPHCGTMEHRDWSLRSTVDLAETTYDPLSVVFAARRSELGPDHPEESFRVLMDRKLYRIDTEAEEGEALETPAGTFRTLRLTLKPELLNAGPGEDPEEFEGLFGLKGGLQIWVDRETRIPVRIRGKIPRGIPGDAVFTLTEIRRSGGDAGTPEGGRSGKEGAPVKPRTPPSDK